MRNKGAPLSKSKRARASGQQPAGAEAQRVAAKLAEAVALHQQGQLDQAQLLYQEILQAQPQHFDALQFLAMTEAQKNNPAVARVLFEQALAINPQHANALNNYGNVLRALKCIEQALASYDRALEIKPDYAEALGNRGAALIDLSRPEEALASYGRVLQLNPNSADVLRIRGNILRDLKRPEEALASYERSLNFQPDNPEVLCSRAAALLDLKRPEEALVNYERALQIQPDYPQALVNRAVALLDLKRYEKALQSCDRALKSQPDFAEALVNRGAALYNLGQSLEALASYDRALKIKPDYAEALNYRGAALRILGRPEEALESYNLALKTRANYPEALCDRGVSLRTLGRPLEALASYDRALRIKPDYAEALHNRGNALLEMNRAAEALESYDGALKVKPDHLEALISRGAVLNALLRHADALANYERALRIKSDYAELHGYEALCRLRLGEFELGWQKYEWRWKTIPFVPDLRNFPQPLWLGKEPLAGKTILLHAEQGLGDTIQFCRYARQVAALGATVVLEVQPALKSLLQGLEGVSLLLERGERLPDFDYHCPLLSLPLAFEADLSNISAAAYLQSEPAKRQQWQARLGPASKTRVGLVWSGATGHQNDHNRSLSLQQITPLIADQAQYYCLQKELRPADQAALAKTPGIQFLGDSLKDFSDTAAVVELMDLVITVDTSVAHLAGAMGKEVWILLPFSPDWRWLLKRSDSPWYGSARLFRQTDLGDWAGVLGQVQEALTERLK